MPRVVLEDDYDNKSKVIVEFSDGDKIENALAYALQRMYPDIDEGVDFLTNTLLILLEDSRFESDLLQDLLDGTVEEYTRRKTASK